MILLDFGGFPWLPQGFRLTFPTQRIVACDGVWRTHQDRLGRLKNPGRFTGDDAEFTGISMGFQWDFMWFLMNFDNMWMGFQGISRGFHWIEMRLDGILMIFNGIESDGILCNLMGSNEDCLWVDGLLVNGDIIYIYIYTYIRTYAMRFHAFMGIYEILISLWWMMIILAKSHKANEQPFGRWFMPLI